MMYGYVVKSISNELWSESIRLSRMYMYIVSHSYPSNQDRISCLVGDGVLLVPGICSAGFLVRYHADSGATFHPCLFECSVTTDTIPTVHASLVTQMVLPC